MSQENPATETERLIAGVWHELLGRQPNVHSNFFEMGGHSVKAQQMILRLRPLVGVRATVIHLLDNPELRSFASVIDDLRVNAGLVGEP